MTYYLHETPGRLRIKIPGLRGHHSEVDAIREDLLDREGVEEVHTNPVTGSITVMHEAGEIQARDVLDWLRECGAIEEHWKGGRARRAEPAFSRAGAALGKALVGMAVERALAPTGLSFLAALL